MNPGRTSAHCSAENSRRGAGFSLIELLVVLALLLILTTMYWGPWSPSRQRQQREQREACRKNLEKVFMALEIYANDHAGKFPMNTGARTSEEVLDALVPRYTADTTTFICPGSKDSAPPAGESFRQRTISYAYYMGRTATNTQAVLMSDRQVDMRGKTAGEQMFSSTGKPPGNNHGKSGGNLLFVDGHVESAPAQLTYPVELPQGVVLLNPKP